MKQRVRGIIIQENKILLINRVKKDSNYWVFPGGGIEAGESNKEALARECMEELGLDVEVKNLITEEVSGKVGMEGSLEYFFMVNVVGGKLGTGMGPEFEEGTEYEGEHLIKWINMEDLLSIDLRPVVIRELVFKKFYQ